MLFCYLSFQRHKADKKVYRKPTDDVLQLFLDSVFIDIENTDVRAEGDVGSVFIQSVRKKY